MLLLPKTMLQVNHSLLPLMPKSPNLLLSQLIRIPKHQTLCLLHQQHIELHSLRLRLLILNTPPLLPRTIQLLLPLRKNINLLKKPKRTVEPLLLDQVLLPFLLLLLVLLPANIRKHAASRIQTKWKVETEHFTSRSSRRATKSTPRNHLSQLLMFRLESFDFHINSSNRSNF